MCLLLSWFLSKKVKSPNCEKTMERDTVVFWVLGMLVLAFMEASSATLSPTGINYEGWFLSFFFLFFLFSSRVISDYN